MTIKESKAFFDASPRVLREAVGRRDARKVQEYFAEFGAIVRVVERMPPEPQMFPTRVSPTHADDTETLNETLSKLRLLLFDEPSHENWQLICQLFKADMPDGDMQVALDYVLPVLEEHWPVRLRHPPERWRWDILAGRACPARPLFKLYDLYMVEPGRHEALMMSLFRSFNGWTIEQSRRAMASCPIKLKEGLSPDALLDMVQTLRLDSSRDWGPTRGDSGLVLKIVPCGEPFETEGIPFDELER